MIASFFLYVYLSSRHFSFYTGVRKKQRCERKNNSHTKKTRPDEKNAVDTRITFCANVMTDVMHSAAINIIDFFIIFLVYDY